MIKPELKHNYCKAYDYNALIRFIEDKYNIKVRKYQEYYKGDMSGNDCPKPSGKPYLDFWHWLIESQIEVKNDCQEMFFIEDAYEDKETPKWVKEILKMIIDNFETDNEGVMHLFISW